MTTPSDTGPGLFPEESFQLTDEVLANLTSLELSNITLFDFSDESDETVAKRGLLDGCKTYPGDLLWPSKIVWKVFDLLLGGALIKTVPFASPCYRDFNNYDAAKCAHITANWVNNSYMQYVNKPRQQPPPPAPPLLARSLMPPSLATASRTPPPSTPSCSRV